MRWLLKLSGLIASIGGAVYALRKWTGMMQERAVEEALAESARERLHFLQRLDHELKNPLTAMQIALANLEDTDDPDKRQAIRDGMRGQILRISHLVQDLRKLATLEKGPMEHESVDPGEMLDEVTLIIRDAANADRRTLKTEFDPLGLPRITGDRDLLQLAVYNLLDNAMKFTCDGGTITLSAYEQDDQLVIQVQDNGRGIPSDDLPLVWDDLYRSKDVQGIPGSGIGLAMVHSIIERHGGESAIVSRYGHGTTVTIYLPVEGTSS